MWPEPPGGALALNHVVLLDGACGASILDFDYAPGPLTRLDFSKEGNCPRVDGEEVARIILA